MEIGCGILVDQDGGELSGRGLERVGGYVGSAGVEGEVGEALRDGVAEGNVLGAELLVSVGSGAVLDEEEVGLVADLEGEEAWAEGGGDGDGFFAGGVDVRLGSAGAEVDAPGQSPALGVEEGAEVVEGCLPNDDALSEEMAAAVGKVEVGGVTVDPDDALWAEGADEVDINGIAGERRLGRVMEENS